MINVNVPYLIEVVAHDEGDHEVAVLFFGVNAEHKHKDGQFNHQRKLKNSIIPHISEIRL